MIAKSNRFFGRDISNIPSIAAQITRNSSQEACKNKKRKLSISSSDAPKTRPRGYSADHTSEQASDVKLPFSIGSSKQHVPEYFSQIFSYIKSSQRQALGNFCEKTINIGKQERGQLVNWITDVHYKFKLFPQTLYFIVNFIDRYLAQKNVQKNKFKLVAIASLYIAAKYEETYRVPSMKDLLSLGSYSYSKRQIIEMEADIIKTLNFDLVFDSSYKILEGLEAFFEMNKKNFHLAQYLLELASTQSEFLQYKQSVLACSAFYLVCKIRKVNIEWDQICQRLTGYKQTDLRSCAHQLCGLLERISQLTNISSLKKKFSEACFHEVTKLRLERKK